MIHEAAHAALTLLSSQEDPFDLFPNSRVEFSGSPNIHLKKQCLIPDVSICDVHDLNRPTVVFEVAYTQTRKSASEKAVVYLGGTFDIQLVVNFVVECTKTNNLLVLNSLIIDTWHAIDVDQHEKYRSEPQHQALLMHPNHYKYHRGITRVEIERRNTYQVRQCLHYSVVPLI